MAAHSEPQRHYHTLQHIEHLLNRLERVPLQDAEVVQLAVWFHDAVYAVPAGQVSNEEASARLAIRELSRVGLEQDSDLLARREPTSMQRQAKELVTKGVSFGAIARLRPARSGTS